MSDMEGLPAGELARLYIDDARVALEGAAAAIALIEDPDHLRPVLEAAEIAGRRAGDLAIAAATRRDELLAERQRDADLNQAVTSLLAVTSRFAWDKPRFREKELWRHLERFFRFQGIGDEDFSELFGMMREEIAVHDGGAWFRSGPENDAHWSLGGTVEIKPGHEELAQPPLAERQASPPDPKALVKKGVDRYLGGLLNARPHLTKAAIFKCLGEQGLGPDESQAWLDGALDYGVLATKRVKGANVYLRARDLSPEDLAKRSGARTNRARERTPKVDPPFSEREIVIAHRIFDIFAGKDVRRQPHGIRLSSLAGRAEGDKEQNKGTIVRLVLRGFLIKTTEKRNVFIRPAGPFAETVVIDRLLSRPFTPGSQTGKS